MKTALFFGSFNPIHVGHLIIANHMVEYTDMDELWFVVTPQNPLKNRRKLLNEYDRLEMVNLSIESDDRLRASDIEFYLPRPYYTVDTMAYLKEKFPDREFALIMGTDTVNSLPKWKNHEYIISNYDVYAYPRPGSELNFKFDRLHIEKTPMMEISASYIRLNIQKGLSVRYLLPEKVLVFIEKWGYYTK